MPDTKQQANVYNVKTQKKSCRPQQNKPKRLPLSPSEPNPLRECTGGKPDATTKSSKRRPVLQRTKWKT